MNLENVADSVDSFHRGMLRVWVWGFPLIAIALFVILFNELHVLGAIPSEAAKEMAKILQAVAITATFGLSVYVLSQILYAGSMIRGESDE
jgi:F0F1-type ATP synthase membrane subunit a